MSAQPRRLSGMAFAGMCAAIVVAMLLVFALAGAGTVFMFWLLVNAAGFPEIAAELPPIWLIRSTSDYIAVQILGLVLYGTCLLLQRIIDDQ